LTNGGIRGLILPRAVMQPATVTLHSPSTIVEWIYPGMVAGPVSQAALDGHPRVSGLWRPPAYTVAVEPLTTITPVPYNAGQAIASGTQPQLPMNCSRT